MPKLTDMFSSLLKLDPSKDYEFSVKEQNQTPPPTTVVVSPNTPVEQPPLTSPEPNPKPDSTVENQANDIAALQQQIQTLQAANLALLNRLPVQQEEKSTEELIYDLCVGTKEERSNAYGIHQTRNGTQS